MKLNILYAQFGEIVDEKTGSIMLWANAYVMADPTHSANIGGAKPAKISIVDENNNANHPLAKMIIAKLKPLKNFPVEIEFKTGSKAVAGSLATTITGMA